MSLTPAHDCCTIAYVGGGWQIIARPWAEVNALVRGRTGDGWLTLPVVNAVEGAEGPQLHPLSIRRRLIVRVGPAWLPEDDVALLAGQIETARAITPELFGTPA